MPLIPYADPESLAGRRARRLLTGCTRKLNIFRMMGERGDLLRARARSRQRDPDAAEAGQDVARTGHPVGGAAGRRHLRVGAACADRRTRRLREGTDRRAGSVTLRRYRIRSARQSDAQACLRSRTRCEGKRGRRDGCECAFLAAGNRRDHPHLRLLYDDGAADRNHARRCRCAAGRGGACVAQGR